MADASRRRPLHTCGASTLTIVWNLYKRVIESDGLVGSITRRVAKLGSRVSPLVCVIQYQCLSILWFVDSYILFTENIIEMFLPVSSRAFNRVDSLIDKVDDLPSKVDQLANNLPVVIHKIPLLRWAVMVATKWLEVFCGELGTRGLENEKEKEIRVDMNCNGENKHEESSETTQSDTNNGDRNNNGKIVMRTTMKCSYKEALEKGVKEDGSKTKNVRNGTGKNVVRTTDTSLKDDSDQEDPLLELFDFGWETPKARFTMSRSASCN